MRYLFVTDELVDPSITATDSTWIKAKGSVWHKSSMKKGIYLIRALIQVQGGGTIAIPRKDGFLDTNYI